MGSRASAEALEHVNRALAALIKPSILPTRWAAVEGVRCPAACLLAPRTPKHTRAPHLSRRLQHRAHDDKQ